MREFWNLLSCALGECHPFNETTSSGEKTRVSTTCADASFQMYPVLVASGGIITFLYDFRHRLLSRLRPRRRRISSTSPPPSDPTLELQPMPSSPANVAVPPLAKTRSAGGQEPEEPSKKPGDETGESSLRQRHPVATTVAVPVPSEAPIDERLRTRLIVPPPKIAYTLGASFIILILTLLVLRAKYPVDPVPRALDFTTNMVIAGVIIFGGGPVVIPLLRGYTVENGEFFYSRSEAKRVLIRHVMFVNNQAG